MKKILEKLIEEHEAEVWEYYKDGYWWESNFRYKPKNGTDVIEAFRNWDFDEFMNAGYHLGYIIGVQEAISKIGEKYEN